jgi:acetyl-CoA acetyltransferase
MKDKVAIVSAATTGFSRHNTARSRMSYVAEASIAALNAAGLTAADVDGVCGTDPPANVVQAALGIPEVTWFANPVMPLVNNFAAACSAVAAGLCDTVLVYHSAYRLPWNTASSLRDPFRRPVASPPPPPPETVENTVAYTAWASRYMYEYGAPKESFGLVAINDRTNAAKNPAAAMRQPLSMAEYLSARMIRWPLCLLDMDVPVDGGDAFVVTTTERARDLPLPPVLVQCAVQGMTRYNEEDQMAGLRDTGQQVTVAAMKAKSDFWIDDCDVYFPYDGFTPMTLSWIESAGWCGPGEAGDFIRQHWDDQSNRILINGRVPVNPHGGALSEGGTQGSGHIREAVHQLQGLAGERQVEGARRAIVTAGGYFFNAQGMVLHSEH